MLEVNQLSRRYGDFIAVDDVSFTMTKGEIVGLLGHNGAGKTTIMKMLSGYLEPSHGTISINGVDLLENTKQVQHLLGYLPENLPVYPEMSVADYLDYAAELKGLQNNQKQSEIKRAIRATELENKLLAPIATLSRGFKQRVGVAQAILGAPELLILDEPTNGLDPTQTLHMRDLIRGIAEHATVIISTHIMQEVEALCDRVIILNRGYLAVDARLAELRQSNQLCLSTSMTPGEAPGLSALPGVSTVESVAFNTRGGEPAVSDSSPETYRYRLTLEAGVDARRFGAAIAKAVLNKGFELYELYVEQRDLETLFREVSEDAETARVEETSHAA